MKTNHFLKRVLWLMIPLLTIFTTNVWAADETLTLAQGSIIGSYSTNTSSQNTSASNAIGLSWTNVLYSSGFQLKADNGEIHSTTYPATNSLIKSIKVTVSTNTALLFGSYNGSKWFPVDFTSGTAKDVENNGFRYFKVTATSSYCKLSALEVVYTVPTYYTITYNDKDGEHTVSALKGAELVEVLSEAYDGADPTSCDAVNYPYFFGWKSSVISGTTTTKPSVLTSEIASANATYYAVWTDVEPVWMASSSIAAGDKVIFCYVNGGTKKEMTGISGNVGDAEDFTTSPAGTYSFWVEAGNGGSGYSFKRSNYYLSYPNVDKQVALSGTKNDASSWTVSFSGTNATITNVGYTSYKLQYNTSSPRFTCYSSSQALPQIYKKAQSGTPVYLTQCCDANDITLQGSGTVAFGTISSDPASACDGTTVTLHASVCGGYTWDGAWKVYKTGTPATTVSITGSGDGATFTMPAYAVTVELNSTPTAKTDHFIDAMQKTTGYTGDGYAVSGCNQTVPSLDDAADADEGDGCGDRHNLFVGWVISTSINADGTLKSGYTIVSGGTTSWNASGATYYAIWAEKE